MEANNNAAYLDENPLVFYSNPGQLQELACVATIASVWYCQMKTNRSKFTLEKVIDVDCSDFALLPSVLKQMIEELIPVVERSFKRWLYFHRYVFFERKKAAAAAVLDFMSFISWHADGTIRFVQTAKKLIKSDTLSDTEKYRIACMYCFVDDIKKLWPVKTAKNFSHPMIEYWSSRMSRKQCAIPVEPGCSCIEASLLKNDRAETRSAFEYLWGFLTAEERVLKVMNVRNWSGGWWSLKYALCKLNERQLEHVVKSSAESIFRSMVSYLNDFVIQFWNRVKNMVTNHQFFEIISGLLYWCSRGLNLAFEMWLSAPNALKNQVLDSQFRLPELLTSVSGFLASKYAPHQDTSIRLLIELLSSTSQALRDNFWNGKWRDILRIISPKRTQQIMKVCLQGDDEIASFKASHLSRFSKIEKYCFEMVQRGNYSDLSDFLELCSDDPVVVFTHRVSVLKSEKLLEHFIGYFRVPTVPELNSFERFLRGTFPDTDQLNEFKKNLIIGEESMTYFRSFIQRCHVKGIALFVDHVLSSMPELSLAKSRFLELSRDDLISGELKFMVKDDWTDFIKWCLNDDDSAVENFKLSLPVDQIFNAYFEKCVARAKQSAVWENPFERMKIPEWIFPTEEAFQNFKLSKLGAYEDNPQITLVIESNDVELIDKVLMWVFNEDNELVEKLKVSLNRVKLSKLKKRSTMRSSNVPSYHLRPRKRKHRSQKEIAKLRKRKQWSPTDSSDVSSYRAKLRKRKTASK
ncbi:uncharacterized protein LOC135845406 isoform X1 [Planococcus citri]|uniref:uncharacterized protein LOC135845406 isoform X1 n=1 Tax=Planococcus citri TaxID=170843 RepID=UPI0031F8F538